MGLPALPNGINGLRRRSGHARSGFLDQWGRPDLYQSGHLLATSSITQGSVADLAASITQDDRWPTHSQNAITTGEERADHFVTRDGVTFAGTHLIIDFWGAKNLDDIDLMEQMMCEAVERAGATLLDIRLRNFEPNGGISGFAVLAESHISVHTWPERDFAAFDIFMCGDARPETAVPILKAAFNPDSTDIRGLLRGRVRCESE